MTRRTTDANDHSLPFGMVLHYEGPEYPVRIIRLEAFGVSFQVERWPPWEARRYKVSIFRRTGDVDPRRKIDFRFRHSF